MNNNEREIIKKEEDRVAASRKEDHIDLAFKASTDAAIKDPRFNYEPIFNTIEQVDLTPAIKICNKSIRYPIWISSMTGGTEKAKLINRNLARLCGEYKLSMGLGSCRQLLYEQKRVEDFQVRDLMPEAPLLVNLGIAQVEELLLKKETARIDDLIALLNADGLIIHINPLQEWLQPEGDKLSQPPLETIQNLLVHAKYPVIVKEVGQGFGPESLKALIQLPLEALDLAGFGGTNFSKLELLRASDISAACNQVVLNQGHSCSEMVEVINRYREDSRIPFNCKYIIISGGIKSYMDGYYLMQKLNYPSLYAQASGFLKYATQYEALKSYLSYQIEGLKMANAYFTINDAAQ